MLGLATLTSPKTNHTRSLGGLEPSCARGPRQPSPAPPRLALHRPEELGFNIWVPHEAVAPTQPRAQASPCPAARGPDAPSSAPPQTSPPHLLCKDAEPRCCAVPVPLLLSHDPRPSNTRAGARRGLRGGSRWGRAWGDLGNVRLTCSGESAA